MSYYTKFGTLLGDSSTKGYQGDLSKYATIDQLKNEIGNLLNLTSVDPDEVVIFQDKEGRLKTSNVKLSDVVVRNTTAVDNNIVTFKEGMIQDSGRSVDDFVKKAGDLFSGNIVMKQNKITDLGNPTEDGDAVTKKYVNDQDVSINNEITAIKTDFTSHVNTFLSFRRNINKIKDEFFGNPSNVNITLANINTELNDINTKLNDIISGIPNIVKLTSMIKIPHKQIKNIVYTVASGYSGWTSQNKSIKYIVEVTGMYRLSVFSTAKFKIITTSWRHSYDDDLSGILSVILNKDSEEEFVLEPTDKNFIGPYRWCLEFVADLS
jgi:hypothetical protein